MARTDLSGQAELVYVDAFTDTEFYEVLIDFGMSDMEASALMAQVKRSGLIIRKPVPKRF